MLILSMIWLAIGIGLIFGLSQRQGSAGLPLAYFLGLSLIHAGAMLYLDGGDVSLAADATRVGFEQTIIGMVAFLGGVLLARYAFGRTAKQHSSDGQLKKFSSQRLAQIDSLARVYLLIGGVIYFAAGRVIGAMIPSSSAIVAALGSLIIVGACLRLWAAREQQRWLKFWSTVALLPLLPLATVVQGGFIGYGTMWVLTVVAFLFAGSRRKAPGLLFAPAVFFVGLSVFVNYMAARDDIRQLVWYKPAGIGERLQRIADVFENFAWLDLSDPQHRGAIDGRLNQNFLVGVAVERLESGQVEYANGATLGTLIVGLVPRALWPDKPAVGGGGTLVTDFTGIVFAEGTSVGAGQVFEFYVNFGTLGVIGGFLLYGFLIGWMDALAKSYLDQDDQRRFLFYFLIGLNMLQPGGNLLEIFVGAVGSAITAYGLGRFLSSIPGQQRYEFAAADNCPETKR